LGRSAKITIPEKKTCGKSGGERATGIYLVIIIYWSLGELPEVNQ